MKRTFQRMADYYPAADRPKCQWCGESMKPYIFTASFRMGDVAERADGIYMSQPEPLTVPTLDEIAGWLEARRMSQLEDRRERPAKCIVSIESSNSQWYVEYWEGWWHGYTFINGIPIFCKQPCGMAFARAAYIGGYRRATLHNP
jgi:hypothetical protein